MNPVFIFFLFGSLNFELASSTQFHFCKPCEYIRLANSPVTYYLVLKALYVRNDDDCDIFEKRTG